MSKFNIGDKVQFRKFNMGNDYYKVFDTHTFPDGVFYILERNGIPFGNMPVREDLLELYDEGNNYAFRIDTTQVKRLLNSRYGLYPEDPDYFRLTEECEEYLKNDNKVVNEAFNHHSNNKTITKIITNYKPDKNPGIYTTVQFEDKFVTVKKSFDDPTIIDLHVACAFAYTKLMFGSHSHFKKTVDRRIQDVTENYKFFKWYDGYKEISITIPQNVDDIYEFIAVSIFNDYLGRSTNNMFYQEAVKKVEVKE